MSAHKWPVKVTILKPIIPAGWSSPFHPETARVDYDRRAERGMPRWNHQIVFQQGKYYGQVGDMSASLTHAELLALERDGFVSIQKVRPVRAQTVRTPKPKRKPCPTCGGCGTIEGES